MDAVVIINFVVSVTLAVLFAYKFVIGLIGLFTKKKFPEAKENHTFAVLIAGRNEEKVIGNLIESIANQNYDKSLISVFVVADNCTDNTALVAKQAIEKSQFGGWGDF